MVGTARASVVLAQLVQQCLHICGNAYCGTELVRCAHHLIKISYCVGFNVVTAYREHSNAVQQVVYNPQRRTYVSLDSHGMRIWELIPASDPGARPSSATIQDVPYPRGRLDFVTALIYVPDIQLYFCACMDSQLRIYKYNLRIKSCLEWAESHVHAMTFAVARNELVIAGATGVKVRRKIHRYAK